ncbi:DUF3908 family protein [Bacillus wiedmannii]|uniref:DUF3908 family protein n=1 Tax=Bacillus wiedmannii TaxID=1890302 RepID=UPI0025A19D1C|nr:DUF3908 family protein [Bacillus wiedmannii]MDM5267593.1 DUF3908 family protein [Bacillus wiedmannii]
MAVITLNEVFNIFSRERYSNRISQKVTALIETLNESGIVKIEDQEYTVYPKNLFREDTDIDLIFFSKKEVLVCKINDNDDVAVQLFTSEKINKIELQKLNTNNQTVELFIHITNEEPIHLSNVEDTNVNWSRKFYGLILDIYNVLK